MSLFVAIFGSFRQRVAFDLVLRPQHAFAILEAADQAKRLGIKKLTLIEFGVASGEGLLNMCHIARKVTKETGIQFHIIGLDTGKGLPPPSGFKDHPDLYQVGDYPMDVDLLLKRLPPEAEVIFGDITDTVKTLKKKILPDSPIGFISVDVDYYTSSKQALESMRSLSAHYLPRVHVYFDDIEDPSHNSYCGELLAIREFNDENELRKLERHTFFRINRILRSARWIDHMYTLHVLDHTHRNLVEQRRPTEKINNYYL